MLKKGDVIPGIASLIIGILTFIYIGLHPKMVILGGTDGSGVGPGMFPCLCAVALTLLGALLVLKALREKEPTDYFKFTDEKKKNLKVVLLMALFIFVYLIVWKVSRRFFVILPVYAFAVNRLFKRSILFSLIFAAM